MLFKLEFGTGVNGTADCHRSFAEIVDRAADGLMLFHAESSALRNSTGAANESIRSTSSRAGLDLVIRMLGRNYQRDRTLRPAQNFAYLGPEEQSLLGRTKQHAHHE